MYLVADVFGMLADTDNITCILAVQAAGLFVFCHIYLLAGYLKNFYTKFHCNLSKLGPLAAEQMTSFKF